jgi:hypothetical protein
MGSLNLGAAAAARVFECPACKETINTSVSQCPYCLAVVDARQAQFAADQMGQINQACSDASYLRVMAGTMVAAASLRWAPIVWSVGYMAYLFLSFAIPIMAIRWMLRFRAIRTDDRDFKAAKRAPWIALGIWAAAIGFAGAINHVVRRV